MGQYSATTPDLASQLQTGSFTALGNSPQISFFGQFNVSIWGTFIGTVELQKSFDGGVTWLPAGTFNQGSNSDINSPLSYAWQEYEYGVYYRLACNHYTSGTINYRLSASNPTSWNNGV